MVLSVPITNHEDDLSVRLWERDGNNVPVINHNGTKTTRRSLKVEGGRVEEASDLVLDLKLVSEVPSGRDRAVCAENTVLPRVTTHLDARPIPKSILVVGKTKRERKEVLGLHQVKRRDSSKLLKTLTTTL